jgi:hypothetical protein
MELVEDHLEQGKKRALAGRAEKAGERVDYLR